MEQEFMILVISFRKGNKHIDKICLKNIIFSVFILNNQRYMAMMFIIYYYHDWAIQDPESSGRDPVSPSNNVWIYSTIFHHSFLRKSQ